MHAEDLAKKLREISVAEFFEKNKHILGYSNPAKALVTCVKEAVDNSLDACEEAGILPDILVRITRVDKSVYRIVVEDNGPGIVKHQIPKIFGKLLYGSRFHSLKQSRGQQGLGISSAVLYAQLTTGKPTVVISKTSPKEKAWRFELLIDTKRNEPEVVSQQQIDWHRLRGTRIELEVEGYYVKGRRQSVYEYLRQTSIVNPHARITFIEPDGEIHEFQRVSYELPKAPKEIKPHPHGIELGTLIRMLKETRARNLKEFLKKEFVRVGDRIAEEIISKSGLRAEIHPRSLSREMATSLLNAFKDVQLLPPPTDCLSPIGEDLIVKSLIAEFKPEFVCAVTRKPKVYSGNPFLVEVGLAYGVNVEKAVVMRFANKIPLLYQQSGCALTKAVESVNWKAYGLQQSKGELPSAPLVILIHLASTNIPYTSESKEAIAGIPEIFEEVKLALQEVGRRLKSYLDKKRAVQEKRKKESVLLKIIPLIAKKCSEILEKEEIDVERVVAKIMGKVYIRREIDGNKAKILVANYSKSRKSFKIYEFCDGFIHTKGSTAVWQVDLKPNEEIMIEYEFVGEIRNAKPLVEGLDLELVCGADALEIEDRVY
jgi:DNA topoisomerase-6 subunit B